MAGGFSKSAMLALIVFYAFVAVFMFLQLPLCDEGFVAFWH
jgi:hypothetical protein